MSESENESLTNISETEEDKINVTKEFQDNVKKYLQFDNEIRELNTQVAGKKKERKTLEDAIIKQLEHYGEETIVLNNESIKKTVTKTQKSLKPDYIKDALFNNIKNKKTVEKIIKELDEGREVVTRTNLKRSAK